MRRRSFLAALGATALFSALEVQPVLAAQRNWLLATWTGPYGGVPPFDKIKADMFSAAFQTAMKEYRGEVARIANDKRKPTFENTIAALEDSGRNYNRISVLFGIYTSTMNDKQMQQLDREWRPKFSALSDEVVQNSKLFKRIETVYLQSKADPKRSPEQQRLTWLYFTNFARSGARLSAAQKKQMAELNQKLAGLYTRFSQNVLGDEEKEHILLSSPEETQGLPPSITGPAQEAAKKAGFPGKWLIANTRSAMEPFLTYSTRRDLREKAWRLWTRRGDMGNAHDNNEIVSQILKLRSQKAKLLGHATYAHWRIENQMAKTPDKAMDLMMKVWPAAVKRVREEVADMQAIVDEEQGGFKIAAWDYRFYAEKVRKAKYDLDENQVKSYFQLSKLVPALFYMAQRLYGFQFRPAKGVSKLHPDVSVYEVVGSNGKHVGLWYFDPFARAGKVSGAWMNEYRTQENFRKPITPVVSNNSNFIKGAPGEPVLLSFDDAETMFHEFGHALHGLNSKVHYPQLAGTNVARDYVEFPSQLHEHWLTTPEILNRYAVHAVSGQTMPADLVQKIEKASTFNQGFSTVEFLASALVDLKLHLVPGGDIDPREFEKKTLAELGMPAEIVMRHRIPQFNHLFSDDGYAAGYYSYLWSDVLNHDAYQAFVETGNVFDPGVAKKLRENIMQVGNTIDPAEGYRRFRGRDASIKALLESRGFPSEGA